MTAFSQTLRMATACLCAAASVTYVTGQEPTTGIVRISDAKIFPVKSGEKIAGQYHTMPGHAGGYSGEIVGECPHCHGPRGKHGCLKGLFCERYCKRSPDHGYSIPAKWPIQRRGVEYNHYYPSQWYGAGGYVTQVPQMYPMVYTPTDTTQLGYYYQHVPFWQPYPNPLPVRPVPAQWHIHAPVVYATPWQANGVGTDGNVIYSAAPSSTDSPTPLQPVPESKPAEPPPSPTPAPLQESAVPLPLERVSY